MEQWRQVWSQLRRRREHSCGRYRTQSAIQRRLKKQQDFMRFFPLLRKLPIKSSLDALHQYLLLFQIFSGKYDLAGSEFKFKVLSRQIILSL